jgi:hypothetical protein
MLSVWLILVGSASAQYNGLLQRNDITDLLRGYQLLDTQQTRQKNLANYSFAIRPINPFAFESPQKNWIMLRQFGYTQYRNDSIAAGYNNESFYQAAGIQTRYTAGIALKLGRLIADFQPEWVEAANPPQLEIDEQHYDPDFYARYYFWNINVIDNPSRFGSQPIKKYFLGQSSVKLAFNNFAVGLSNENIWWGPGLKNSLVMTNHANGFKHFTFHTIKPLKTILGTVEAQFVAGRLDSSGIEPPENERQKRKYWMGAYIPKPNFDRGMMGFVFTYQPKWIKNLFLGIAGSTTYYKKTKDSTGKSLLDPYPYFVRTDKGQSLTLGSVFFRYAMPNDRAEIYGEFGRSDRLTSPFNIIKDTIPLGFVFGIRKWLKVSKNSQIELMAEVAQLQLQDARLILNDQAPWGFPRVNGYYTHPVVRHGYTHNGQMLGAGIGPGSNSQYLSLSWYRKGTRLGIHGERIIHNNDFVYAAYLSNVVGRGYHNRYYTDLIYGAHLQIRVAGAYLAASISKMNILNYKWVKLGGTFETGSPLSDKKNVQASFSVLYDLNLKQSFPIPKPIQQGINWVGDKLRWTRCDCKK